MEFGGEGCAKVWMGVEKRARAGSDEKQVARVTHLQRASSGRQTLLHFAFVPLVQVTLRRCQDPFRQEPESPIRCVGRRSQTERKKKPARSGRDDWLAGLAQKSAEKSGSLGCARDDTFFGRSAELRALAFAC
jgi:hypothetical protein